MFTLVLCDIRVLLVYSESACLLCVWFYGPACLFWFCVLTLVLCVYSDSVCLLWFCVFTLILCVYSGSVCLLWFYVFTLILCVYSGSENFLWFLLWFCVRLVWLCVLTLILRVQPWFGFILFNSSCKVYYFTIFCVIKISSRF